MLYAPPVDRPPILRVVARSITDEWDERSVREDRFDVTKLQLPAWVEVGETVYRLKAKAAGTFFPGAIGEDGEFIVPEFLPDFVGRGRSITTALQDWRDQVHCRFQEIYAMRPFEMTERDWATWRLLESQIDVGTYRDSTPLTVRQLGRVIRARPRPEQIQWEDGHKEVVQLDQMPGEFATYKPGQPFAAIVLRDPVDFHLIKVSHVQRTGNLPEMSAKEFDALVRAIPTTATLPDADWD